METIFRAIICIAVLLSLCVEVAVSEVHYDTAWTFVYDGGDYEDGDPIGDQFRDVKLTPKGNFICVGITADSSQRGAVLLMEFDKFGKPVLKKTYSAPSTSLHRANSVTVTENGDYIVGGLRGAGSLLLKFDMLGNVKWATWYYDSIRGQPILHGSSNINCVQETTTGQIICALGDRYADETGSDLSNYAAVLKFDSTGKLLRRLQWSNPTGYDIGGFYIEETSTGCYLLSGNKALYYIDTSGGVVWQKEYTYMLEGVGSTVNTVNRAKMLRDGSLMVAGQSYESNCWVKYNNLYYDAWWSSISYAYGTDETWNTFGQQGGDDNIFDFTQLVDGNLVFVGRKSSVYEPGGVWAFVTDSRGDSVLWERRVNIPWGTTDGRAPKPLAVCANPDSGFTVVGQYLCNAENGGMNAFVARFVPSTPSVVSSRALKPKRAADACCTVEGEKIVFRAGFAAAKKVTLQIFNASGMLIAEMNGKKTGADLITWDCSAFARGVYCYKLNYGKFPLSGRLVVK